MPDFNQTIPGATTILSKLQVRNNPDLPVVDTAHIEGGAMAVLMLSNRDAIPAPLRRADVTTCYVGETDTTYVLRGGIANADWQIVGAPTTLKQVLTPQELTAGTAYSLTLPLAGLFDRAYTIPAVQGLPNGLSYNTVNGTITGTTTKIGSVVPIIIIRFGVDSFAQLLLALNVIPAVVVNPDPDPVTVPGVVFLDVRFDQAPGVSGTETHEYTTQLVFTEPSVSLTGTVIKVAPSNSTRFLGTQSVGQAMVIAAFTHIVGTTPSMRLNRFGFDLIRLRAQYPGKTTLRFRVEAKRGVDNPSGSNYLQLLTKREGAGGLLPMGGYPIDFASAAGATVLQAVGDDGHWSADNAGNPFQVGVNGEVETRMMPVADLVLELATGAIIPTALAQADPVAPETPTYRAYGDPVWVETTPTFLN